MPPSNQNLNLFLAFESAADRAQIRKTVEEIAWKYRIVEVASRGDLEDAIGAGGQGVMFTALGAFEFRNIELIASARATNPRLAIVIVEPELSVRAAVSAVKAGAVDAISTSDEDLRSIPEILAALPHFNASGQAAGLSREDDSLLRTVIDNLHAYIYIRDADGRFVLNNRPNVRMLGASNETETIGKTLFDFFPKATAERFDRDDKQVLKTGQPLVNRETPYHDPAGNQGWLQTTKMPLRDKRGKVNGVIGISRDITKHKRAQRSLQESEQRYRQLVDLAPDAVLVHRQGKILFANPMARDMLGAAGSQSLLGLQVIDMVHADSRTFVKEHIQGGVSDEQPNPTHEVRLRCLDGREITVETRVMPIRYEGEPAVLVILRDITERHLTQQNRRRLATVVEQSAESIFIIDTDGVIRYVNPTFERVTGYPLSEAVGETFDFIERETTGAAAFEEIIKIIAEQDVWMGRFTTRRKDGGKYEEIATIYPVRDADGEILEYIAINRDITREVTLEEQVRLAQKMEAVGLLAGGVAHDFNNLLQIIQGYSSLVIETLDEDDPRQKRLTHVCDAADRGAQLTRQLMAFGRREPLTKVAVNLNSLVDDLLKLIKRLIGEDIEVVFNSCFSGETVHADKGQLEQSLINLIINARDAMPKGGRITIDLNQETLSENARRSHPWIEPGDFVKISVADTGCGMSKETLTRIFEPFFTTKAAETGTGLGLSVVYGIIKQHGGIVHATSESDHGTRFDILLPNTPSASAQNEETGAAAPQNGTETILLAEDESEVRELEVTVLEHAGYRVLTATNGEEACRVFEKSAEKIEMLLFDVVMPKMSGRDAYEHIKSLKPNVPVLFCSGYSGNALRSNHGIDKHMPLLQKPFRVHDLLFRVRETLDAANPRNARS
ncbi:MAG: PAS domain S-box protein [Verrucomicrobiia bacterium]|jgi:two-component system cell cycle sensor histidine kinase/response regulator CckA